MKTIPDLIACVKDILCRRPEVIVDFIFNDGLLYIAVKNIGVRPAYRVSTQFDQEIRGVAGEKNISDLALFKCIEFLPPQKEIRTFLDSSASYFERNEPVMISTRISYQDYRKRRYVNKINHNLEIYKDIGYIQLKE
ncbi:MAG: hypothetical protein JRF38_06565 [Deltaproteobacteria bacterium]|jgi:hypothetical protein|nr:hypothetical protein [Deltaproteobacteria bacterium]